MDRKAFASALGGGSVASRPLDGVVQARSGKIDDIVTQRLFAGATFGLPEGYTTRDTGTGKHEILDAAGNVVGTGYDDLDTTLTEWQRQNILGSVQQKRFDPTEGFEQQGSVWVAKDGAGHGLYGPTINQKIYDRLKSQAYDYWTSSYLNDPGALDGNGNPAEETLRQFKSKEEIDADLNKLLASSSTIDQVYGDRNYSGKWPLWFADANRAEAIGILANPTVDQNENPSVLVNGTYTRTSYSPGSSNHVSAARNFVGLPNTVRGNSIDSPEVEEVKGEHAMYGSQPVFNNGRLIGYKVDTRLMPKEAQDKMKAHYESIGNPKRNQHQVGDYGVATAWNRTSSATQNTMYRELNQGWDQFSKISDTEYFVPINKVGEVPGWKNTAQASYENWADSGGFFDKLIPAVALGALTFGIGSALGGAIAGSSFGTAIGATASNALGGAIAGGIIGKASGGDFLTGAITGGLGGAMSGWSPIGAESAIASSLGKAGTSLANSAIKGVISGGVGTALRGGDIGTGMLTGGLSAAAGSYVGDMFGGSKTFSGQLAGGLARTGTGLLASYALRDTPDAPNQPTQQKSTATGYAPVQSDMGGMNMRQRLAASMRSY